MLQMRTNYKHLKRKSTKRCIDFEHNVKQWEEVKFSKEKLNNFHTEHLISNSSTRIDD